MDYRTIRYIRIGLAFLLVVFVIWFIIWIFRPRGEETPPPSSPEASQLETVRYVQRGRIVASENHQRIVITISESSRRIDIYRGYNSGPEKSEVFPNTKAAYDAFYAGIQKTGFFNTREQVNEQSFQSSCPLGVQYQFLAGDDIVEPDLDSWTTSCSSKNGNFAGNRSQNHTMFTKQIPEYSTVIKGVKL
jgi:hypothetical protein